MTVAAQIVFEFTASDDGLQLTLVDVERPDIIDSVLKPPFATWISLGWGIDTDGARGGSKGSIMVLTSVLVYPSTTNMVASAEFAT